MRGIFIQGTKKLIWIMTTSKELGSMVEISLLFRSQDQL